MLDERVGTVAVQWTGAPVHWQRISGVGGPGVVRITGPKGQVIAKTVGPEEAAFYREWAPEIRRRGLGVPILYAQVQVRGQIWLLMEALEATLDVRTRGERLPDLVGYLAKLHRITKEGAPARAETLPTRPVEFQTQDVDDALSVWPEPKRQQLARWLDRPWPRVPSVEQFVSGDPNPTNWGWRASGQLVLFDWSEAAWSHPAYDLAVLCGGLPAVETVRHIVDRYWNAIGTKNPAGIERWVAWVISARLVAFVWFAAWYKRGRLTAAARPGLTMLQEGLVEWIEAVHSAVIPFCS